MFGMRSKAKRSPLLQLLKLLKYSKTTLLSDWPRSCDSVKQEIQSKIADGSGYQTTGIINVLRYKGTLKFSNKISTTFFFLGSFLYSAWEKYQIKVSSEISGNIWLLLPTPDTQSHKNDKL